MPSPKGYRSQLTKVVSKANEVIFENQNTKALKDYEYQLDNFLSEIHAITAIWIRMNLISKNHEFLY